MGWNYRIIDTIERYKKEKVNTTIEHLYAVHEVYYDENQEPYAWSENGIRMEEFEDIKEIEFVLDKVRESLQKPIMTIYYDGTMERLK